MHHPSRSSPDGRILAKGVWAQHPGVLSPTRHLCGSHSYRQKTRRPAGVEGDKVRVRHQSQNRQSPRHHAPQIPAGHRRRGNLGSAGSQRPLLTRELPRIQSPCAAGAISVRSPPPCDDAPPTAFVPKSSKVCLSRSECGSRRDEILLSFAEIVTATTSNTIKAIPGCGSHRIVATRPQRSRPRARSPGGAHASSHAPRRP
jgi:hypothetical protein